MPDSITKKPQRKQTSLELSAPVRGALRRLKSKHGYTKRFAIERGVLMLETSLSYQGGKPV